MVEDMAFYNAFTPEASGTYPLAGISSDEVTVTDDDPVSTGTLEVAFEFTDIPADFTDPTLTMDFLDLDLQGDTLRSGWQRLTLFEAFRLYDDADTLLDTLDDNDNEDDDFAYSIAIADELIDGETLDLKGEIEATVTLTRGWSLRVSNAEEGIENIYLCGTIEEEVSATETICHTTDQYPWEETIEVDTEDLADHFAHGDYLGECDGRTITGEPTVEICHVTDEGEETIVVDESDAEDYLSQPDYFLGACEDDGPGYGGDGGQDFGGAPELMFDICHVGEDGETNLTVAESAVQAHLAQGSYEGECDGRTSGGGEFYEQDDIDCQTQLCGIHHYVYGVADDPETGAYGQYFEVSTVFESAKNAHRLSDDIGNDPDRLEMGDNAELVNTHFLDPDGYPAGENLFEDEIINAKVLTVE